MSELPLQEHGGDVSAGYAEMGSKGGQEGGSKGGQARKEQLAEVSTITPPMIGSVEGMVMYPSLLVGTVLVACIFAGVCIACSVASSVIRRFQHDCFPTQHVLVQCDHLMSSTQCTRRPSCAEV